MLRRSQRGWSIIAALTTASVAIGIFGVSTVQLQAQADEERVPDLILLKDAAHVQMSGGQPVYDEFGLPIGLDSTADAPIGHFEVGDYVVYRINVLNRNYADVNSFTVSEFLPEGSPIKTPGHVDASTVSLLPPTTYGSERAKA